jgi:5-methylthioadenosine/S-adenosylhomocysteine deaminase
VRRYHARWVLPIVAPPIEHGTVVVSDGRIAWVGTRAAAPAGAPEEDVELGDAILLPGLVNVHTHLELTAMRGFLEQLEFHEWIRRLTTSKKAVLGEELLLDSARLGIAEGLAAGITTYADTCDSGVALPAMQEMGVRGIMYQEAFGPAVEMFEESLAGLRAKLARLAPRQTALVRLGVSPHAPYSVHRELFGHIATVAREAGLPMAVHIAESRAEHELVAEGRGAFAEMLRRRGIPVAPAARSPIALLEAQGVLGERTLLIHCVRLDDEDVRTIARHRSAVAHCPASNAKLGHGIAPLCELLAAGVRVGLGSDSVASNNRMDVVEEARLAALLQCARRGDPTCLPPAAALELATLGGARALGLEDEIGSLEAGKAADLAAFPLDDARGTPTVDPLAALVFALAGRRASFVSVAGRELVRDGRLLGEDAGLRGRVQRAGELLAGWLSETARVTGSGSGSGSGTAVEAFRGTSGPDPDPGPDPIT